MTALQVSKAVKGALIVRVWAVTAEQADGIDATLTGADYRAKIHLAFDTPRVKVSYVDSSHRRCEIERDGQRMIHLNCTGAMRYLSGDIGRNLEMISAATVTRATPAEGSTCRCPGGSTSKLRRLRRPAAFADSNGLLSSSD